MERLVNQAEEAMTVEAILNERDSRVVTVRGDTPVATAIGIMRTHGAGALVVSDDGRRIDGILAERDLIRAFRSLGADRLDLVAVTGIMRRSVRPCRPTDSLRRVMAWMTARRIGHMPVVDASGLRGVISMTEVVGRRLKEAKREIETVHGAGRAAGGEAARSGPAPGIYT